MGSNERSWPGTGRPSSARLNSLANAQPPKLQRRERGAGHLSLCLSPSPPKAAIFFPSPFLPLTVQAKEKFKRRRRSNQKGMKVQPKQKPCYGQKSANSLYRNGCRTRFSHGLRKTNFQLLSLSLSLLRCTPLFVFCQDEASAASLSARLFLKDMRSYPAQPFPLPANPNKAGMLRETEGALFLS